MNSNTIVGIVSDSYHVYRVRCILKHYQIPIWWEPRHKRLQMHICDALVANIYIEEEAKISVIALLKLE